MLFLVRLIGLRSLETISDAVNRVEPFGVLGIVAKLCTEILDVRVDGALVALEVIAENLLDKLHAVVNTTGMARKRGKQLELGGREVNLFALDENLMA